MNEILERLGLLALSQEPPEQQMSGVLSELDRLCHAEADSASFLARHNVSTFAEADQLLVSAEEFQAEEKVRAAFADGKLSESMREWALSFAKTDPVLFDSWYRCAPRIIPDNLHTEQAVQHTPEHQPDEEESRIFAMLGLTSEDVAKN